MTKDEMKTTFWNAFNSSLPFPERRLAENQLIKLVITLQKQNLSLLIEILKEVTKQAVDVLKSIPYNEIKESKYITNRNLIGYAVCFLSDYANKNQEYRDEIYNHLIEIYKDEIFKFDYCEAWEYINNAIKAIKR